MAERQSEQALLVAQQVAGGRFGMVRWVSETGSTNADLLAAARDGQPEQALITDFQSAGRGRRDRRWLAAPGTSLMMSVLVRRGVVADRLFRITMAMGLAAVDAVDHVAGVQQAALNVTLKWPNDVLVGEKKLAGILAETAVVSTPVAVVGIGMNVLPEVLADLPADVATGATSLGDHVAIDSGTRVELAANILKGLARGLESSDRQLVDAYRNRLGTIGQQVTVDRADGEPLNGEATGVTERGSLIVRVGTTDHTLSAGDVSHLRRTSEFPRP